MGQITDNSTDDGFNVLVLGVCIVQIFAIYKYDTLLLPKTFHVYDLWFTLRPARLHPNLGTPGEATSAHFKKYTGPALVLAKHKLKSAIKKMECH